MTLEIHPPKSLVRQGWAKSLGVFLLGITGVVTSFTVTTNLDETQAGRAEDDCRADLEDETSRLAGEIGVYGWSAVLDTRGRTPSPEEVEQLAAGLQDLIEQWEDAQARRGRADEICGG